MDLEFRDERGQALPLLLVVLAVALVAVVVLARVGRVADDAARARSAADASALAGASAGRGAAEDLAAINGGVLIEYREAGSVVEVVVRVGAASARARAEQVVEWVPSGRVPGGDE